MAQILFITDTEEGHLYPTLGLAEKINADGHILVYVGIADNEPFVTNYGFPFEKVLVDRFPRGFRESAKRRQESTSEAPYFHMMDMVTNGEFHTIFLSRKPELIIVSASLSLEALLIYHQYKVRTVIFTPYLASEFRPVNEGYSKLIRHTFEDLFVLFDHLKQKVLDVDVSENITQFVGKLDEFTELVACPRELDLPSSKFSDKTIHIGPCIRTQGVSWEERELFENIRTGKKIIFCTMGSQSSRFRLRSLRLFDELLRMMSQTELSEYHLIISSGFDYAPGVPMPPNVSIRRTVPQIEVLRLSHIAVIHGGLGSVKECIYGGVPMLVLPATNDQPMNAERVAHHRIGIVDDLDTVTASQLSGHITRLSSDIEIRNSVEKMRRVFQDEENLHSIQRLREFVLPVGVELSPACDLRMANNSALC